jgi:hypothetical protein
MLLFISKYFPSFISLYFSSSSTILLIQLQLLYLLTELFTLYTLYNIYSTVINIVIS